MTNPTARIPPMAPILGDARAALLLLNGVEDEPAEEPDAELEPLWLVVVVTIAGATLQSIAISLFRDKTMVMVGNAYVVAAAAGVVAAVVLVVAAR